MTIKRIDGKETNQYTLAEYEVALITTPDMKENRIGEIVIDVGGNPSAPTLWVANVTGHLNSIGGGSGAGAFTEFTANGNSVNGTASTVLGFDAANVQFGSSTRTTVGIDIVQPTSTSDGSLQFRVTPTGVPIDNPFSANFDMSSSGNNLQQDYATLGDEIGADWTWDLAKNPLAGLQIYDLGSLT